MERSFRGGDISEKYARAEDLNLSSRFEEAIAVCKALLDEPELLDYHRILVCICIAHSTNNWTVAEVSPKPLNPGICATNLYKRSIVGEQSECTPAAACCGQ